MSTDPLQQLGSSGRYCGIGHPDDALRSCILRPGHEVPHRTMDGRRWSDPEHGLQDREQIERAAMVREGAAEARQGRLPNPSDCTCMAVEQGMEHVRATRSRCAKCGKALYCPVHGSNYSDLVCGPGACPEDRLPSNG